MGFALFLIITAITSLLSMLGFICMVDASFSEFYLAYLSKTYPGVDSWGYDEYRHIRERLVVGLWALGLGVALLIITLFVGNALYYLPSAT